jgi:hypothetical protein
MCCVRISEQTADYFITQHELIGFDNSSQQPFADGNVMLVLRGRIHDKELGPRRRHVGDQTDEMFLSYLDSNCTYN